MKAIVIGAGFGGTVAITTALGALMTRHGIEVNLNTRVGRIEADSGVAAGVTAGGGQSMSADVIVSNADPAYLYASMMTT